MGKGTIDEAHPLSMGVVGYVMGRGARTFGMRAMIERADVVLLVGNRTNQNGTDSWKLFPRGHTIHLNFWDYNDVAPGYFAAAEIAAREPHVGGYRRARGSHRAHAFHDRGHAGGPD
mgnify:CR=1 FL=1